MERREFLINSYTGSGVAWILNFLIELDILVYRNNSISKTWEHGNNHYKLKKQEDVLKQWCPVLSEKNEFEFRENVSVRWAHEFPSNNNIKPKVILLVRDGRDTIYSQFKREKKFLDFDQMLSTPVEPFNLLPADTWALMNLWWTNSVKTENLHIIRFEDFKSNPLPYMKDLLNFLHISRSENDILRAIESSSFDRAKKAEENYRKLSANTQFEQVNRKGQPGEWKKIYNNEKLMFFEGLPNLALGRFGYKEDGTSTKALENLFDPTSAATDKDILALTALKQVYKNFQQEKDDKYATKSHIFLSKAIDLIKKHGGLEDLVEKEIDNDVYTTVCPLCNSSNIVFIGKINQEKKFATTKINLIKVPELWRCRKCESSFIQNITRETEAEKMYSLNNGIRWPSCKIINSKPKNIIQKISSLIHPGAKILDIGCGAGDLLDFAKDLGAKT